MFPTKKDCDELLILTSRSLEGINYEEIGVFCIGSGRNGKGLFFDGVKNCLGDYYATLDYSYFTKHKEDTRNPALYSIRKGRIINVSEPPKGLEFLTDIFKSATGRDEKKVRTNYQTKDTAIVFSALFLQSNHYIKFSSDTEGTSMKDRLLAILFQYTFKTQKEREEMKSELE